MALWRSSLTITNIGVILNYSISIKPEFMCLTWAMSYAFMHFFHFQNLSFWFYSVMNTLSIVVPALFTIQITLTTHFILWSDSELESWVWVECHALMWEYELRAMHTHWCDHTFARLFLHRCIWVKWAQHDDRDDFLIEVSRINCQKGHQLIFKYLHLEGKSVAITINLVSLPVQFVGTDAEIIRGKLAIREGINRKRTFTLPESWGGLPMPEFVGPLKNYWSQWSDGKKHSMIKISLSLLYFRLVTKEGPNFSEVSVDICGDQHNGLYSSRELKMSCVAGIKLLPHIWHIYLTEAPTKNRKFENIAWTY